MGSPMYEALHELIQVLYSNSKTIKLLLGGGKNGHIGIIMKPTLYEKILDMLYERAEASDPPTYPHGCTDLWRQLIKEEHAELQQQFDEGCNVKQALKNQILEVVEKTYLLQIRDLYTPYMSKSARDMLDHLFEW